MGSPDPRNIIRGLSGSLCIGPTDATEDFPHGGTALGLVRDGEFRPGERARLVKAEEFGNVVVEALRVTDSPVLSVVLREWDDDALAAMYPDVTTGGRTVIRGGVKTNTQRAGARLSDLAVKLVHSPREVDQHPWVVIYRAIPVFSQPVLDLRTDREVGHLVAWYGIPDSQGRLFQIAHRGDVEL